MPLTTCPDCEKQISDAAPSCIHCGRPMQTGTQNAPAPQDDLTAARAQFAAERREAEEMVYGTAASKRGVSAHSHSPSALACIKCRSPDVQRLDMIWRGGTSSINANTAGVGVGGGGLGVGAAKTKGTQRTVLAEHAAPPKSRNEAAWWLGLFLGVALLFAGFNSGSGLVVLGMVISCVCGFVAWEHHQYNAERYPALFSRWQKTFQCMRCGQQFVAEQF